MATDLRRTHLVRRVFEELAQRPGGDAGIRPGAINAELRARETPMGAWEVRVELTHLEAAGEVRCDPATGLWFLADAAQSKKRSSG